MTTDKHLRWLSFLLFLSHHVSAAEDNILETGPLAGYETYSDFCSVCHGEQMQGAAQGTPLVGEDLTNGDTLDDLARSIAQGFPDRGMPAWSSVLDEESIRTLALLIVENRSGLVDFNVEVEINVPEHTLDTLLHKIRIEEVTADLDPFPYSLTVLPDNSIVVTEKKRGLRIVSPGGDKSDLIAGTPDTYSDVYKLAEDEIEFGAGWLLDVEQHPDYQKNGWIYLHFTERCDGCGDVLNVDDPPTSRNVLVRGRIDDGRWVDQETIWTASEFDANFYLDVVAGGRIAFDPEGFVFMTVGMRSMDGIQDLRTAYGKTHRVHDDGRIPADNPFVDDPNAVATIWTYGHRSPQGLVFNAATREIWGTEHGPRGGDEINRLLPGRNYGWPLYSGGQNYDGTPVEWGRKTSEVAFEDTEPPVVEFTPSIAISNLVVYEGAAFPEWRGDFLVGSLKASDLYRIRISDGKIVDKEIVVENLARIRDIDVNDEGIVYLLLEHASGGRIVRIVPN